MNSLVLGARGSIGRHIAQCLSSESDHKVHLSSHSNAGVGDLVSAFPQAQAVKVDFYDAASVANAVSGMHRVIVISPDFTDENIATGNLIKALDGSETLEQVIRVLGLFPDQTEETIPEWMREINATCWQHQTARRLLMNSDLPVTLINPASRYMQNYRSFIGPAIRDMHVIPYPYEQTIPHIDTRDIAEVIVQLLKQDAAPHVDKEYLLTGAKEDIRSCTDVAALFSNVLGFTVEYKDDPEFFAEYVGEYGSMFADYLKWQQQTVGDYLQVSDQVERLLGKEPRKLRDWISENADFFRNA